MPIAKEITRIMIFITVLPISSLGVDRGSFAHYYDILYRLHVLVEYALFAERPFRVFLSGRESLDQYPGNFPSFKVDYEILRIADELTGIREDIQSVQSRKLRAHSDHLEMLIANSIKKPFPTLVTSMERALLAYAAYMIFFIVLMGAIFITPYLAFSR